MFSLSTVGSIANMVDSNGRGMVKERFLKVRDSLTHLPTCEINTSISIRKIVWERHEMSVS